MRTDRIDGAGLLTRAQMAAIINRAFAAKKTADLSGYNDVSADAWYRSDLAAAVAMGTFQGADGQLNPERPITARRRSPYWHARLRTKAAAPLR
ncbi:MAG: S-layer homology domain-containing protein [Butyricicoccaceae bacterium]